MGTKHAEKNESPKLRGIGRVYWKRIVTKIDENKEEMKKNFWWFQRQLPCLQILYIFLMLLTKSASSCFEALFALSFCRHYSHGDLVFLKD